MICAVIALSKEQLVRSKASARERARASLASSPGKPPCRPKEDSATALRAGAAEELASAMMLLLDEDRV